MLFLPLQLSFSPLCPGEIPPVVHQSSSQRRKLQTFLVKAASGQPPSPNLSRPLKVWKQVRERVSSIPCHFYFIYNACQEAFTSSDSLCHKMLTISAGLKQNNYPEKLTINKLIQVVWGQHQDFVLKNWIKLGYLLFQRTLVIEVNTSGLRYQYRRGYENSHKYWKTFPCFFHISKVMDFGATLMSLNLVC